MKKISIIVLGIFTVIILSSGIFLFLIMVKSNNEDDGPITNYLGSENLSVLSKPTIEFSGKSDHFSFKTGKLVIGAKTKEFVISCVLVDDFIQTEKIKNIKYLSLSRHIDDDEMIIFEDRNPRNTLNKKLNKFGFFESGIVSSSDDYFEKDYLTTITSEEFKDKFRLEITFCTKNDECYGEDFEISYNE